MIGVGGESGGDGEECGDSEAAEGGHGEKGKEESPRGMVRQSDNQTAGKCLDALLETAGREQTIIVLLSLTKPAAACDSDGYFVPT
jgi:hypothetical protein